MAEKDNRANLLVSNRKQIGEIRIRRDDHARLAARALQDFAIRRRLQAVITNMHGGMTGERQFLGDKR